MEYQIDTSNYRTQEVRVGQNDQEVAVFRKANFFIQNLKAQVDGAQYHLKLAAPWNGFRFQLRQADQELANAKKSRRMQAFDPDRPLHRDQLVEFQLEVAGQPYLLTPIDRHGLTYIVQQASSEIGRLAMRPFEEQQGADWKADLTVPNHWAAPLAAFIAWLAREGQSAMSS